MRPKFQKRSALKFDGRINPDELRIGARPQVGTTNTNTKHQTQNPKQKMPAPIKISLGTLVRRPENFAGSACHSLGQR